MVRFPCMHVVVVVSLALLCGYMDIVFPGRGEGLLWIHFCSRCVRNHSHVASPALTAIESESDHGNTVGIQISDDNG